MPFRKILPIRDQNFLQVDGYAAQELNRAFDY